MASPTLITPTSNPKSFALPSPKSTTTATSAAASAAATAFSTTTAHPSYCRRRREAISLATVGILSHAWLLPAAPALAASDEEYVKDTEEVISKVKATVNMDKNDPNVATAVADLRESSNTWVAKYRREKTLLARSSYRDVYSALNAVSGHYGSFGPTAPIPAKRKARILEEVETAEKALQRGR